MDRESFATDVRTRAAVERKFEIVSEAVDRLHKDRPELAMKIPEMRRIVDFPNFLGSWLRRCSAETRLALCIQ